MNEELIKAIQKILEDFEGYPKYRVAQLICNEILRPEMQKIKDNYERLFFTDTSREN